MKKHAYLFAISLLACFIFSTNIHSQVSDVASKAKKDDFELLMKEIRDDFAYNPPKEKIDEALKKYNEADGSFSDIDYSSIERVKWLPLQHVNRIYDFAFAYTNPENEYYENEALYDKIVKGLEFWYDRDPWCHNWWYNQIAEPQALGILLVQMREGKKQIPVQLEKKTLDRIVKDGGHPAKWTGANRTDIALHWIYRSCLERNEEDLKLALDNIYNPVAYTTKEGFQHDNSYFQHGVQLYIGGYGSEIVKGVTQVAKYTKGTQFALPPEKLELLSKYMRETYYPAIRGRNMLFDALGRRLSRPNATDKGFTSLYARRMLELDPQHSAEYESAIARVEGKEDASFGIIPKHTHYYRGDYTLHVRPHFTFDARMASTRTMRCEYGNMENLKTYFLSDGCTNIAVNGDEYVDIYPTWNWTRIPGVTAPQLSEIPLPKIEWLTPGVSTFAGGVSNGSCGVSAYSYHDTYSDINTVANKSWFFFDDEVVCLGSGITSTAAAEVNTTVNQTLTSKEKEVIIGGKKGIEVLRQDSIANISPRWVLHNDVAYIFPGGGNIFISQKEQSGSWYDINHTEAKDIITKNVFTIGFNHELNPTDADYAYVVVPGLDSPKQVEKYLKKKVIEICSNNPDMQVVKNRPLGIYGMVFYSGGTYADKNIEVSVDKPCVLMIEEGKKAKLYIADPAQKEEVITLSVRMPKRSKDVKFIICDFRETGVYAGQTKNYELE